MSRNRHLYTVGEKVFRTTLRRCNTADVFERDPFKIQSYNFRYAERPAYTMQHYRRPESTSTRFPDLAFETYYYNRNFDRRCVKDNHNLMCKVEVNNASKFQDYRRRKFLYDIDTPRSIVTTITGGSGRADKLSKRQPDADGNRMGNMSNLPLHSFCHSTDYLHTVNGSSSSCIASSSANLRPRLSNSCRKFAKEYNDVNGLGSKNSHLLQPTNQINIERKNVYHGPTGVNFGSRTRLAGSSSSSLLGDWCNYQNTSPTVTKSRSVQHLAKYRNIPDVNRNNITSHSQSQPLRPSQISEKHSTSVLNAMMTPKKSSGCEININICAVDNKESSENVHLQIEAAECKVENTKRKLSYNSKSRYVGSDEPRSDDSIKIDKHLSKYSMKHSNFNTFRQENDKNREQERELARERERKREAIRVQERKLDMERLLKMKHNGDIDRERELDPEKQRHFLRNLHNSEVACEHEKERYILPPPLVVMQSPPYRQTSTDRLPSMVPFVAGASTKLNCSPKSPNTRIGLTRSVTKGSVPPQPTTRSITPLILAPSTSCNDNLNKKLHDTRARRVQAASCILNNLRDLKHPVYSEEPAAHSQTLNTTHLPSLRGCERKLLNAADPFHTSLNNVPIRITTLTRRMPSQQNTDVAFSTIHVRSISPNLKCGQSIKNSTVAPYNVNINVYADNMKMMPI